MEYIDYLYAIILGIVQGVTEFLPVSSSGHLILLHEAFNFATEDALSFDLALHVGSLASLLVYFTKDILYYLRTKPQLMIKAVIGCIPAGVIGALFSDTIDQALRSSWVVVGMLLLVSIVFLAVERYAKPTTNIEQLSWPQVLAMGVAQALALIPGTSRSGITLATGMGMGMLRAEAARFSFLMVIPLYIGITAKQALDLPGAQPTQHELILMALGAVTSAIVGIVVIGFLLEFFKRSTLRPFAYYRIGLAVVVSLLLLL